MNLDFDLDLVSAYWVCQNWVVNHAYRDQGYKQKFRRNDVFAELLGIFADGMKGKFPNAQGHAEGLFEKELFKERAKGMTQKQQNEWETAWGIFMSKFSRELRLGQVIASKQEYVMKVNKFRIHGRIPVIYMSPTNKKKTEFILKMPVFIKEPELLTRQKILHSPYFLFAHDFHAKMMRERSGIKSDLRNTIPYLDIEFEFIDLGDHEADSIRIKKSEHADRRKYCIKKSLLNSLAMMNAGVGIPSIGKRCNDCPAYNKCRFV
jgi:hypothetical protein